MVAHCFVTIDAETDVIQSGIRVITELREQVEAGAGIRIPLTWFVRFQRDWDDYLEAEAEAFELPVRDAYDGFAMAYDELLDLRNRGDEIGWHYHANNWVYRDDLSHATRLEILRADLASCARELRTRHPEFAVRSFRFGWFFVPDYAIYDLFEALGITRDASIDPGCSGGPVPGSAARYLPPLATAPTRIGDLTLFPRSHTVLLHDWTVVAHDFDWSRADADEAAARRAGFAEELKTIAARLEPDGGEFFTYETAPPSLIAGAVHG
jgi:hypothetical protein